MLYQVELVTLTITPPSLESLNDPLSFLDDLTLTEMQAIEESHEFAIWSAFFGSGIHEESREFISRFPEKVPPQVAQHVEIAFDTGAFWGIEIWECRDHPFWLLVGYANRYYVLASWQRIHEKHITIDLVKKWIRAGLYPQMPLYLKTADVEEIKEFRKEYEEYCDLHDRFSGVMIS